MELGQDMEMAGRHGRMRHGRRGSGIGKSGRQSRVRQEVEKREWSIRGGKSGGRRQQQFPIVTFPALAYKPSASQFHPSYILFLKFATSTNIDLAAPSS
jgi:hypothetical protein